MDFIKDGISWIKGHLFLIIVTNHHFYTNLNLTSCRMVVIENKMEEGRLANAIRTK